MEYVLILLVILCIFLIYKYYQSQNSLHIKFKEYVNSKKEEIEQEKNKKIEEMERKYRECKANYDEKVEMMNAFSEQQEKQKKEILKKNQELIDIELSNYKKKIFKKIEEEARIEKEHFGCAFAAFVNERQLEKEAILEDVEFVRKELEDFHYRRAAVNEAIRREREISEKEDFYKIQLTSEDIEDIELLKTMTARLQHKELIPKLIWTALVQRPTNEMIKRITGGKMISGIYKITYIPTGEAYIGKTTDIKTRWTNHIGTALGLNKAASSTLHTHMAQHGIQNYTFEILEEVEKDKLSEREKFYIELYGTVKQLNMKAGG